MKHKIIIGISGPSASGKTTIAKKLAEKINTEVVSIDNYFDLNPDKNLQMFHGIQIFNYDKVDSIDWDLLVYEIDNETKHDIIILEGFILFGDKRIEKMVDALINIEFSGEEDFGLALERRISRGFHAKVPDDYHENPVIDRVHFTCSYFEEIVWPEMLQHPEYRKPNGWNKPLLELNAKSPLEENVQKSFDFTQKFIESRKTKCYIS